MDTKFTKGKWVANASEFPFPHGHVFIQGGGFDVSRAPDCVANAYLIAAAPDMHDELVECLDTFKAIYALSKSYGAMQSINRIEKLLAKIRGEL